MNLLYEITKIFVKIALTIFCRKRVILNRYGLSARGPLLLVANHPNSFLDAIIIAAHCKYPIHFLARGDAFNKPWHNRLLHLLNMIPIYRISEGKEFLALNEWAFSKSKDILKKGGIVLIFIEGTCVNSHTLQPFKKGAARIAIDCRKLPAFRVLPLALVYDSFTRFGKKISLTVGEPLTANELLPHEDESRNMRYFNEKLFAILEQMLAAAPVIPPDKKGYRYWYLIQGVTGYFLHAPFYFLVSASVRWKTAGTVFYDSVLFGALLLLYPVYLLLVGLFLYSVSVKPVLIPYILLLHPLMAHLTTRWLGAWEKPR